MAALVLSCTPGRAARWARMPSSSSRSAKRSPSMLSIATRGGTADGICAGRNHLHVTDGVSAYGHQQRQLVVC